jgi:uncharacterized protein (TIGR03083 family)
METDPHIWIRALRDSHDHLVAIVRPLTPEQLTEQSYDTEWSIAQVLSHLGSGAELAMGWVNAAVQGVEAPGQEANTAVWDAWNYRSPERQALDSLEYGERLVRRYEALTEDELSRLHIQLFGVMELDAAGLCRVRLSELAIHIWDIDVAVYPTAHVDAHSVALLIDALGGIATRAGKPQGKQFTLRVRTTEPVRDLKLAVGDEVHLDVWAGGTSDGELRLPAEEFVRLVYGRLDPDHTKEAEIIAGSITLDDIRQVFPGV